MPQKPIFRFFHFFGQSDLYFSYNDDSRAIKFFRKAESILSNNAHTISPSIIRQLIKTRLMLSKLLISKKLYSRALKLLWTNINLLQIEFSVSKNPALQNNDEHFFKTKKTAKYLILTLIQQVVCFVQIDCVRNALEAAKMIEWAMEVFFQNESIFVFHLAERLKALYGRYSYMQKQKDELLMYLDRVVCKKIENSDFLNFEDSASISSSEQGGGALRDVEGGYRSVDMDPSGFGRSLSDKMNIYQKSDFRRFGFIPREPDVERVRYLNLPKEWKRLGEDLESNFSDLLFIKKNCKVSTESPINILQGNEAEPLIGSPTKRVILGSSKPKFDQKSATPILRISKPSMDSGATGLVESRGISPKKQINRSESMLSVPGTRSAQKVRISKFRKNGRENKYIGYRSSRSLRRGMTQSQSRSNFGSFRKISRSGSVVGRGKGSNSTVRSVNKRRSLMGIVKSLSKSKCKTKEENSLF